ncbi:MAG TPA: xanthine dehydrogenase family protein subunit M [Anaerolineaceae bacterium]|nr:xanthine dehydrogenase family protein subunit M [Anaerolineaceae bacterium]
MQCPTGFRTACIPANHKLEKNEYSPVPYLIRGVMQAFTLLRPTSESELLSSLSVQGSRLIAGGTDLLPRFRRSGEAPAVLVDLSRLASLRFLQREGDELVIGARTTQAELADSPLVTQFAPALAQAAASVGSPQTRNRATIGGNLVNASPAADTLPPLLAFGASVALIGPEGRREQPLDEFLLGPGQTSLQSGEYLHSVRFPIPSPQSFSTFIKLGKRSGMAIAVASAAAFVQWGAGGCIEVARVALGSVAPTARRSPAVEQSLTGQQLDEVDLDAAAGRVQLDIAPITDVRATAAYRRSSAQVLLRRALESIRRTAREVQL